MKRRWKRLLLLAVAPPLAVVAGYYAAALFSPLPVLVVVLVLEGVGIALLRSRNPKVRDFLDRPLVWRSKRD